MMRPTVSSNFCCKQQLIVSGVMAAELTDALKTAKSVYALTKLNHYTCIDYTRCDGNWHIR